MDPKGGDRDQIRAVAAGDADIAIVNTYYLGGYVNMKIKKDVEGKSLKKFFPAQNTTGNSHKYFRWWVTKYAKKIKKML